MGQCKEAWTNRSVSLTNVHEITENILLEAVLRHVQDEETCNCQHGSTKGRLCLTNLDYNGLTTSVGRGSSNDIACLEASDSTSLSPA